MKFGRELDALREQRRSFAGAFGATHLLRFVMVVVQMAEHPEGGAGAEDGDLESPSSPQASTFVADKSKRRRRSLSEKHFSASVPKLKEALEVHTHRLAFHHVAPLQRTPVACLSHNSLVSLYGHYSIDVVRSSPIISAVRCCVAVFLLQAIIHELTITAHFHF